MTKENARRPSFHTASSDCGRRGGLSRTSDSLQYRDEEPTNRNLGPTYTAASSGVVAQTVSVR